MRLFKSKLLALVILCLVFTSCSKEDSDEGSTTKFDIDLALALKNDNQLSSQILSLVNIHRTSLGLSPLKLDTQYASAYAVEHTEYMIELERINHDNFSYRSEGIKYHDGAELVGENVSYGYETAEKAVQAWLNSPTHRDIIEGDFTHTGFGIMKCDKGRNYFTQIFYRK